LPAPENQLRHGVRPKNLPPEIEDAPHGDRKMRLTSQGEVRADLIDHVFHFGVPGDVPITGDWNGDGIRTIGVFRDGTWYLDIDGYGRCADAERVAQFGQRGDTPVVGDWAGNGIDKIGVYRGGQWMLDVNRNYELDAADRVFELGGAD